GWRMVESWHLVRRVTKEPISIYEENLRRAVFSTLMDDGLSYRRLEDWCDNEAFMWDQGRALITLCTLAEGDDCKDWAIDTAKKMLNGLDKIALRNIKGIWFPSENWDGKSWGDKTIGHPPTGLQLEGAIRYYHLTKDEYAIDFAQRVADGLFELKPPILNEDCSLGKCGGGPNLPYTHIHSRLFVMAGIYRLGKVIGNKEYMQMADKAFDSVLKHSTSYGWVPESMEILEKGTDAYDEVCCMMDVLKFAVMKAEEDANWYDLIERYIANSIAAHQLDSYDKYQHCIKLPEITPKSTRQIDYENILDRSVGSFTGALHAHEFWRNSFDESFNMNCPCIVPSGCCTPAGITSYCIAWENTLIEKDNKAIVNMHFQREGEFVLIEKASQECGDIAITIKKPISELKIKLHPWANVDNIKLSVDSNAITPKIQNGYILIQNPKDNIELNYDSVERVTDEPWSGGELKAHWQGNRIKKIKCAKEIRIPLY
ncbi:MAG: hypothetical protein SNJ70_10595, partial [Armatimonadota bacterium]